MVRHVLACVDGTAASERSLPWVRLLMGEPKVTLLRVMEAVVVPPVLPGDLRDAGSGQPLGEMSVIDCVELAKRDLEALAKTFAPTASAMVRCFTPASKAIAEVARELDVDLIALTTTGGSKLGRRVFGGTTERLLHSADAPLLVVPAGPSKEPPTDGIRRIVVPLDGSEASEAILPLAESIAGRHDAVTTFVHVGPSSGDEPRYGYLEGHLRVLAERWERRWLRTKVVMRRGEVLDHLHGAVAEADADLVVMSAHGFGALKRAIFGSTASEFIRLATVPVIVARRNMPVEAIAAPEVSLAARH